MQTQNDQRTLKLLRVFLTVSAALMLWGAMKMHADVTIFGFIFTAFLGWALMVHQSSKANEVSILKALSGFGYLTEYQISGLTLREVHPDDVLSTLNRLEDMGLLMSRVDPDLGKMWRVIGGGR